MYKLKIDYIFGLTYDTGLLALKNIYVDVFIHICMCIRHSKKKKVHNKLRVEMWLYKMYMFFCVLGCSLYPPSRSNTQSVAWHSAS